MGVQIYWHKKNFDVQKAERFFKERRVAVQMVDLKKHRLGERELQVFAGKSGVLSLIDRDNPRVKEHPIAYTDNAARVTEYLLEHPEFLRSPIIRNGQKAVIGFQEADVAAMLDGK